MLLIANKNKIGGVFDMKHFAQLIETFQKTVESNNAKFFVILYPNKNHINYFQESIKLRNLKVNYFVLDNSLVTDKKFKFKNDVLSVGNFSLCDWYSFLFNNDFVVVETPKSKVS